MGESFPVQPRNFRPITTNACLTKAAQELVQDAKIEVTDRTIMCGDGSDYCLKRHTLLDGRVFEEYEQSQTFNALAQEETIFLALQGDGTIVSQSLWTWSEMYQEEYDKLPDMEVPPL